MSREKHLELCQNVKMTMGDVGVKYTMSAQFYDFYWR